MKKTILLACLVSILSLQSVHAIAYMGMEAAPNSPNAETPKYFLYESLPGQSIQDSVKVSNTGDTAMDIRVYAVETEINAQGDEVLKPYQGSSEHLGKWTSFDNQPEINFTLEPNQSKEVGFTINIPVETAKQEYQGGIMVEKLNKQNENLAEGVVIQTNGRVGIKTFITVTDNPRTIKKLSEIKSPTTWTQTYFYVSLGLFVVVIGAFAINAFKKKKRAHHKE